LIGDDHQDSRQVQDGWGLFVFRRVPVGEYQLVLDHRAARAVGEDVALL